MTAVAVPNPVRRRAHHAGPHDALVTELRSNVDGEVRFDDGSRSAYSTDASNYRHVPAGVVVPRTVDAAVATVDACRQHGVSIVSRGGGTSLAGQATNTGVVIDWSKYLNRLVSLDASARRCIVEPGIVLDHLNDLLAPHDLEFGPRPSTHSRCTLGGMIGNNSCGSTAQRTGKVVDNIHRLEVLLYDGTRMWVGATSDDEYTAIASQGDRRAEIYRGLRSLRDNHRDEIRRRYPHIPRRVSGYNLDSLLPEYGFDVARALVGSEGTLVSVLRAELLLVPRVTHSALAMVAFPDIAQAGDAVPAIVACSPIALEGIDDKLVDLELRKAADRPALSLLPDGSAWLLVQMGGASRGDADDAIDDVLRHIGRSRDDGSVVVYDDPEHQHELWSVREAALGATARSLGAADTWPGFEDSAVAPERLGDYLRDLGELFDEFGYGAASLYGHFGQGCVHTRIPFDLLTSAGVHDFRDFMQRAAELVVSYGGSLSGEHGDGQARAELLSTMFGPQIIEAFESFKGIFDPDDRMNPGRVARPRRLDQDLRMGTDYAHVAPGTHFAYPDDEGNFARGVLRCVGVGQCRREHGGVMCPSYMVTREEEHSTRGRARLLFEMLDGEDRGGVVHDGWRSTAVRDALDLCLMCKGCKSDCPVNVDMATYKAEFLSHHYAGRVRPRSHYSMGWLPLASAVAAGAPGVVNAIAHTPGVASFVKYAAGIDRHRTLPRFAPRTFQTWFRQRPANVRTDGGNGDRGEVVLWPDTFMNHFDPAIGRAALRLVEDAGWTVTVPSQRVCCGLTWISTGQLVTAKRVLERTLRVLRPALRRGAFVLGLEPSCTAVFRSDARELFPADPDIERLRTQTVTLAELLQKHSPGWSPPTVHASAIVQTHCHHHAVLGTAADDALLTAAGVEARRLDSGCCGLAGNFGFEAGHFDVSAACAERVLLPEIRAAAADDVVLADGFSCRTQIEQLGPSGRHGVHLAQLLVAGLPSRPTAGGAP